MVTILVFQEFHKFLKSKQTPAERQDKNESYLHFNVFYEGIGSIGRPCTEDRGCCGHYGGKKRPLTLVKSRSADAIFALIDPCQVNQGEALLHCVSFCMWKFCATIRELL